MNLYDYFIKDVRRFGIVCHQKINEADPRFLFAWQIYQNKDLYCRFDDLDRHYIQSVAEMELKDDWYIRAGNQLKALGYHHFLQMTDDALVDQRC